MTGLDVALVALGGWFAFNRHYFWSKRYTGVDAVDPEPMAWRVARGLPGSNWLTLLGRA